MLAPLTGSIKSGRQDLPGLRRFPPDSQKAALPRRYRLAHQEHVVTSSQCRASFYLFPGPAILHDIRSDSPHGGDCRSGRFRMGRIRGCRECADAHVLVRQRQVRHGECHRTEFDFCRPDRRPDHAIQEQSAEPSPALPARMMPVMKTPLPAGPSGPPQSLARVAASRPRETRRPKRTSTNRAGSFPAARLWSDNLPS